MGKPRVIEGREDAARELGVAPSSLREWMHDPSFPDCSQGHPIAKILKWRSDKQNYVPEEIARGTNLKDELTQEKINQARVDTKLKELKLAVTEGQYYPRQAAELALATLFTEFSDWTEQSPDIIVTSANVPKKYQAGLKRRIIEEFNSFRNALRDSIASSLKDLDTLEESTAA